MQRFTAIDSKPVRLPPVYGYRTHPLLPLREALEPIISRIDQLEEFIKDAKSACHFPSEHGLTRDESASIYLYTMEWGDQSLYRVLNEKLRAKDRSELIPWHGYLKLFDTALKKLPSSPGNLWRGINGNVSQNYKSGEPFITWWNFSSCSTQLKTIQQFLGPISTLFMIEAKNGKDISIYSNFPNETENILCLGTRLSVKSDPLINLSLNIVHLVEITDDKSEGISSALVNMSVILPKTIEINRKTSMDNVTSTYRIHTFEDGSRYEGDWNNMKKHGKGTCNYADRSKYTGDWIDGRRSGQGLYVWPNGARYEGQYTDDKRNGKGTYCDTDGNKYVGDWVDDKMEGQCIFTWSNGDRYEGTYKNNRRNGKGTYFSADGNKYTGDWINDLRTGQGVFTFSDGTRYEGQFKDDKKNGKGTMYFSDGSKCIGHWINDKITGHCIFTSTDGTRYEGQYKDGKKNGKGTFYYANGNMYAGDWVDGRKTGQGIYNWSNGIRYQGEFKDDKMSGRGTMFFPDGKIQDGMWFDDKFMR